MAVVAGGILPKGSAKVGGIIVVPLGLLGIVVAVFISVIAAAEENSYEYVSGGLGGDAYAIQHFEAMYRDAAQAFGVNPYLLMGVHREESDFGRSELPGVTDGDNGVCCAGPMQFSIADGKSNTIGGTGATWGAYADAYRDPRVKLERPADYPNRFEPHPNVYDSYDSIYAAAKYLAELGAGPKLDAKAYIALLSYTGTPPFSAPVAKGHFDRAKEYERMGAQRRPVTQVPVTPGSEAQLLETGLASIPENAPESVKRMIHAANNISDKKYDMVHFPTHIGNPTYDCTSSSTHVLWAGGKFGPAPVCSAFLEDYGVKGPGDWVTLYVHGPCGGNGHAFLEIAGLRFDTSSAYEDGGPNAGEDGPRWRRGERLDKGDFRARAPEGL